MNSNRTERRSPGFTLVEIMIVVAIIGLLSMIALPNFLKHRNSVRVKACMGNLRVINQAKASWAIETGRVSSSLPVTSDIIPYLRDGRMPECPADGTYRIRSVRRTPICSLWSEGHSLGNLNGDDDPSAE